MLFFVLGIALGIGIAVVVKNSQDIKDIHDFEIMFNEKVAMIDDLKAENSRLHTLLNYYQAEEAKRSKGE